MMKITYKWKVLESKAAHVSRDESKPASLYTKPNKLQVLDKPSIIY